MAERMTAEAVREAARKLEAIESVDKEMVAVMERFARAQDGGDALGAEIRKVIGRNVLTSFSDDVLAHFIQRAVMTGLLEKRASLAAEVEGFILIPPPSYGPRGIPGGPVDG